MSLSDSMSASDSESEHEMKYWDEEDQCVYHGLKRRQRAVPLASIAGMYGWVYSNPTHCESSEYEYAPSKKSGWPGFFTISFPADKKPSIQNFRGELRCFDVKGSFTGVKKCTANGKLQKNSWTIKQMKWDADSEDMTYGITEGHELELWEVLDENGNPFLTFVWDTGWSGCSPTVVNFVGKKQVTKNGVVGLTDDERDRMGMRTTESQVERRAKAQQKTAKRKRKAEVKEEEEKEGEEKEKERHVKKRPKREST